MRHKLAKAEKKLKRQLAGGWERAVFTGPQRDGEPVLERVLAGPGLGDPEDEVFSKRRDEAFTTLMRAASDAADAGLVKQTFVLDARRHVKVDARHGHTKLRERDEESLRKTMGGKSRPLRPDDSGALLRAIGIANADGTISARNAKKYKQVNHLVELCRPVWAQALEARPEPDQPLRVLDLGCGNSYLDFVLAEALRLEGIAVRIAGVDARPDLVARSEERARTLGFDDRMAFFLGTIASTGERAIAYLGGRPEIVVALHACDTATDEALALAIRAGAPAIMAAPCCQAELARQLGEGRAFGGPRSIAHHSLLRRAYADVVTDALRVEVLEACGYDVATLEFVGSEHTPKNLLIRARRRSPERPVDPSAFDLQSVLAGAAELGVRPTLFDLLASPENSG